MTDTAYQFCPRCKTALVARELGGRARQACPREECGFVAWDNPVPVVAAIVERNGEVVLVRNIGRPEGWYGLVAGFLEKGERMLPTALASMTAKYLRELAMRPFNAFWRRHIPGLKPTAGYPADARRFLDDIRLMQRRLGIEDRDLWRER